MKEVTGTHTSRSSLGKAVGRAELAILDPEFSRVHQAASFGPTGSVLGKFWTGFQLGFRLPLTHYSEKVRENTL